MADEEQEDPKYTYLVKFDREELDYLTSKLRLWSGNGTGTDIENRIYRRLRDTPREPYPEEAS